MEEATPLQTSKTNLTSNTMHHHPLSKTHSNSNKERKLSDVDVHFKIRALVPQLRPHFIEVLQIPDFRNCKAAHELRKQIKIMMDLCKQMTTDTEVGKVTLECQRISGESVLWKQSWEGHQDRKLPQTTQASEKSAVKRPLTSFNSRTKLHDDQIRRSYIVGGSVFGRNLITFAGSGPVYYGVTKEFYRNTLKRSKNC